jgi:cytochrome subunit of sulfide dehydrogenase
MKTCLRNRNGNAAARVVVPAVAVAIAFGVVAAMAADGQKIAADDAGLSARVQAIAQTCAACHGTAGRLQTAIPPLAGKPEAVMSAQLLAFKRDEMPGATVMPRLAKGYTDKELKALARYFASLKPEEE